MTTIEIARKQYEGIKESRAARAGFAVSVATRQGILSSTAARRRDLPVVAASIRASCLALRDSDNGRRSPAVYDAYSRAGERAHIRKYIRRRCSFY